MNPEAGRPFESIESAHDFVSLLAETVTEAKKEIDTDVEKEVGSKPSRRMEALRLVSYSLEKLALHMKKSCRILNDLRSLRRLLLTDRTAAAPVNSRKTFRKVRPLVPVPPVPGRSAAKVGPATPKSGGVAAA